MTSVQPRTGGEIVVVERFIEATRDSGYKGTPSAVAELVDNALDAGASRVHVRIARDDHDEETPLTVAVMDDGAGMSAEVMKRALGFGGSTRFDQRGQLGRFGMGLPNSSVSQAKRVTLFSWQEGGTVMRTHLDVDEVASGALRAVPAPVASALPVLAPDRKGPSGTMVLWTRCDRLDNKRPTTLERKLRVFLGRVYRHHIWRGVELLVNGRRVVPVDPLFLHEDSVTQGGASYGGPMRLELPTAAGGTAVVEIRYAELPVADWHALDNKEKRRRGIAGGAGVSVVRGDREIEYGWLFFSKRKENYDDWWRCEVRFDPVLDEQFGITHTKQQVRPSAELVTAIGAQMDRASKTLNSRVRKAYLKAKEAGRPPSPKGAPAGLSAVLPQIASAAERAERVARTDAELAVIKRYRSALLEELGSGG